VYAKPLDFHWLAWDEEAVAARMRVVEREMALSNVPLVDSERLRWFMCTVMGDEKLIANMDRIFAGVQLADGDGILDGEEGSLTPAKILKYLHKGRYILTIRKNNLYVIRRELFYTLPSLGTFYGTYKSCHADPWFFNAEGQFRDLLYFSGISIYDYSTLAEEMSLQPANLWKEEDFFDLEGKLINPNSLYCVVRK
jgi:hypothetical protein